MTKTFSTICIILVLLSTISYGQNRIRGTVTDTKGKPVPYSIITYKNTNIGVYSDEYGDFVLPLEKNNDTLRISCIGYETLEYVLREKTDTINLAFKLKEKIYALSEIEILNRNKTLYGDKVKFTNGDKVDNRTVPMYFGCQDAVKVQGLYRIGRIEHLQFYVMQAAKDNNKVRIRIMTVDSITGAPLADLTKQYQIIVDVKQTSWAKVDLSEYNINAEKDFFVVFESLATEKDFFNVNTNKSYQLGSYNVSIATSDKYSISYGSRFAGDWIEYKSTFVSHSTGKTLNYYGPYIEVIMRKEK